MVSRFVYHTTSLLTITYAWYVLCRAQKVYDRYLTGLRAKWRLAGG
ncbi:MAG TPA: hypothetical protein VI278_11310 [Nitrososphaeraceae archaeon]